MKRCTIPHMFLSEERFRLRIMFFLNRLFLSWSQPQEARQMRCPCFRFHIRLGSSCSTLQLSSTAWPHDLFVTNKPLKWFFEWLSVLKSVLNSLRIAEVWLCKPLKKKTFPVLILWFVDLFVDIYCTHTPFLWTLTMKGFKTQRSRRIGSLMAPWRCKRCDIDTEFFCWMEKMEHH